MLFKKCDFISPHITFYFKGNLRHSSVFSGILTILSTSTTLGISLLFIIDIFNKSNPNAFYFQKYLSDSGYYELSPNGLFHFVTFGNNLIPDLTKIKIIGVSVLPSNFFKYYNQEFPFDHWEYQLCRDIKSYKKNNGNKKEENEIYYEEREDKSFCVYSYYNYIQKTYYNVGEEGFIYPSINYDALPDRSLKYGIFILKNDNFEDSYLRVIQYYTIHFVDNYIDVDNYKRPFFSFFYNITSSFSSASFTINHLNFSPLMLRTSSGLIINSMAEKNSHVFYQNEKISYNPLNAREDIIGSYFFWMQNRAQIYQRSYKKIQDALANISGVSKIISVAAYLINKLYNEYIIVSDFEQIFDVDIGQRMFRKKRNAIVGLGTTKPSIKLKREKSIADFRKKRQVTLEGVILHLVRIKRKRVIAWIYEFRERVLSEEKVFKIHLLLKLLKKRIGGEFPKKKVDILKQLSGLEGTNINVSSNIFESDKNLLGLNRQHC